MSIIREVRKRVPQTHQPLIRKLNGECGCRHEHKFIRTALDCYMRRVPRAGVVSLTFLEIIELRRLAVTTTS